MLIRDILYWIGESHGLVVGHEAYGRNPGWHLRVFTTEIKTRPGNFRCPRIGVYQTRERAMERARELIHQSGIYGSAKMERMAKYHIHAAGYAIWVPDKGHNIWFWTKEEAVAEAEKRGLDTRRVHEWIGITLCEIEDKEYPLVIEPEKDFVRPSVDAEWDLKANSEEKP